MVVVIESLLLRKDYFLRVGFSAAERSLDFYTRLDAKN